MAWIELDGAVNVRDLGDMPTEDGQKTARGSLLRADNLQDLSAADVRKLVQDIGVTTVVDLRSSNELAAEGPAPLDAVAGVRHAHHPVLPEVGSATDVIVDALLARDRMDKFRYPGDPVCGHYLGYLAARLRRSRLYSRDVNSKPADLQRPRAETMAAFLEQMDARYGGVASWLTGHGCQPTTWRRCESSSGQALEREGRGEAQLHVAVRGGAGHDGDVPGHVGRELAVQGGQVIRGS